LREDIHAVSAKDQPGKNQHNRPPQPLQPLASFFSLGFCSIVICSLL
jgi:hypothetical protein